MKFSDALPDSQSFAQTCSEDGEFRLAIRFWDGGIKLAIADKLIQLKVVNGRVSAGDPGTGGGVISLGGSTENWEKLLAAVPERLHTDVMDMVFSGKLTAEAEPTCLAQYYAAVARAVELLRPPLGREDPVVHEGGETPRFDSPVGRYIHLELGGHDHRIYFEEAGQGIPLLMQHTAGAHGIQFRHLFEVEEITDHFRPIAYDLPYHGKSLPPVSKKWWVEEYRLKGDFVRSVPVELARALRLDRPVFMGCSVGGMLALDLAYHHPEEFRAVISLEGALKPDGDLDAYSLMWHPQVSNEFKARVMNGTMSPMSPERYRKETSQVYAAGWPPLFLGDLYYYLADYDLTGKAQNIDTIQCPVHILSGEFDISGTVEKGREAHEAIAGSTFTYMESMGHFPMSENPARFIDYLLPVLRKIRDQAN